MQSFITQLFFCGLLFVAANCRGQNLKVDSINSTVLGRKFSDYTGLVRSKVLKASDHDYTDGHGRTYSFNGVNHVASYVILGGACLGNEEAKNTFKEVFRSYSSLLMLLGRPDKTSTDDQGLNYYVWKGVHTAIEVHVADDAKVIAIAYSDYTLGHL